MVVNMRQAPTVLTSHGRAKRRSDLTWLITGVLAGVAIFLAGRDSFFRADPVLSELPPAAATTPPPVVTQEPAPLPPVATAALGGVIGQSVPTPVTVPATPGQPKTHHRRR